MNYWGPFTSFSGPTPPSLNDVVQTEEEYIMYLSTNFTLYSTQCTNKNKKFETLVFTFRSTFSTMVVVNVLLLVCLFIKKNGIAAYISAKNCPNSCWCSGNRMMCHAVIPQTVPNYTTEIILSQYPPTRLVPNVFCNVSWNTVNKLDIRWSQGGGNGAGWIYLRNDAFRCLQQIEYIKFNISYLVNFTDIYFDGLENIIALDFSDSLRLTTPGIVHMLSLNTSFPKLTRLILSGTGAYFGGIDVSQDLIDVLSYRGITELDVTFTPVSRSTATNISGICDTIATINVSQADFIAKSSFGDIKQCSSLKTLDLSGASFPKLKPFREAEQNFTFNVSYSREHFSPFLTNLYELYLNSIAGIERVTANIYNSSVTLDLSLAWSDIHFSGYTIPVLDLEIKTTNASWKTIDLSHNNIEHIGPKLFKHLQSLTKVDLSGNRLTKTSSDIFSDLFKNNTRLEQLNLNGNMLITLPLDTLVSNIKLKKLYLSHNFFKQLTFDISQLTELEYLDLSHNSIEYLNEYSIRLLDDLYDKQISAVGLSESNTTFVLYLSGNPFTCQCSALQFLQWFIQSPLFKTSKQDYRCTLNRESIPMDAEAVRVSNDDCERPIRRTRKIVLSVSMPATVMLLLSITGIILVRRRGRLRYYRRMEYQLDMIQGNMAEFTFPVFLSYSSEDSNFVYGQVYKPLQVCLKKYIYIAKIVAYLYIV